MAERCQNCGREGTLVHVEDVVLESRTTEIHHTGGHVEETADQRVLLIQRCGVCHEPTISTYRYVDGFSDPTDHTGLRRIYPETGVVEDLPERVAKRYREMLELQYEPDAFAVRAGRTLEAICSDQGVTEGDLGARLDQLAGKKRQTIPRALAEQAHLVREFRNVGGHDDDIEVELDDVPMLRGFVEALLAFLYWGPVQLERGRVALEARIEASGDAP
jgi:hypothetical protein